MPPSYPGSHHQQQHPMNVPPNDSNSISSGRSKGSRNSSSTNKKRTIDGVHGAGNAGPSSGLPSAYAFRRTDSGTSTTSTLTAGNNTSGDISHGKTESPQKKPASSGSGAAGNSSDSTGATTDTTTAMLTHDDDGSKGNSTRNGKKKTAHAAADKNKDGRYHRRDYSHASTASSLSVGGFSLGSYEGPRGKNDWYYRILFVYCHSTFAHKL